MDIYQLLHPVQRLRWMFFAKVVNGWKLLTIILKELPRRCLTVLQIHLCDEKRNFLKKLVVTGLNNRSVMSMI